MSKNLIKPVENEEFLIRAKNRNYYADELSNIIIRSDNKGKKSIISTLKNESVRWENYMKKKWIHIEKIKRIELNRLQHHATKSGAQFTRTTSGGHFDFRARATDPHAAMLAALFACPGQRRNNDESPTWFLCYAVRIRRHLNCSA